MVEYLARYSHRIALSDSRLLDRQEGQVQLRYKDYRDHDRHKVMALSGEELIRRFLLHILPKGFVRIRHYGILASSLKNKLRELVEQQIGKATIKERPPLKYRICYTCGKGQLVTLITFDARGPPPFELLAYLTPN